jgi:low affinity Fe/Cu permease
MRNHFARLASRVAEFAGTPWMFIGAVTIVAVWAVTGPLFHYSDTWQLVINTGTTIVTFLMVFLIQNTQNRDAKAIHLKLDELLRAAKSASNNLIDIEEATDEDLAALEAQFRAIHEAKAKRAQARAAKTGDGAGRDQEAPARTHHAGGHSTAS